MDRKFSDKGCEIFPWFRGTYLGSRQGSGREFTYYSQFVTFEEREGRTESDRRKDGRNDRRARTDGRKGGRMEARKRGRKEHSTKKRWEEEGKREGRGRAEEKLGTKAPITLAFHTFKITETFLLLIMVNTS